MTMELVPLFGAEFNVYAPIIVLIMGALTLLNVYARILNLFGIESEDAVTGSCTSCNRLSSDDIERIAEGKKLVNSQLRLLPSAEKSAPSLRSGRTSVYKDTSALLSDAQSAGDDNYEISNARILDVVENPLSPQKGSAPSRTSISSHSKPKIQSTWGESDVEMAFTPKKPNAESKRRDGNTTVKTPEVSAWGEDAGWGNNNDSPSDIGGWGEPSTFLRPGSGNDPKKYAPVRNTTPTSDQVKAKPKSVSSTATVSAPNSSVPPKSSTIHDISASASSKNAGGGGGGGRYKR